MESLSSVEYKTYQLLHPVAWGSGYIFYIPKNAMLLTAPARMGRAGAEVNRLADEPLEGEGTG